MLDSSLHRKTFRKALFLLRRVESNNERFLLLMIPALYTNFLHVLKFPNLAYESDRVRLNDSVCRCAV